ncbi:MAG: DUF4912 domain-containing protein, partial [Fibrobacter sp.]|nr:DUF4912 domain-containing protein [Fibrobacter sp.]
MAVKKTTAVAKKAAPKASAKTAAKAVEKKVEKTVKTAATKAKTAVETATKRSSSIKKVADAVKATAKALAKVAKSAPKASEQTDVSRNITAKKSAKPVAKASEKVSTVKASAKPVTKTASLAQSFDAEYLVLMQKDPNWMQAFWDVSEDRIKRARKGKGKLVLRLFNISGDLTVKRNKKRKFHDVEVPADARSWYVENKASEKTVAVLGFAAGKNFMPLVESAPVQAYSTD